MYKEAVTSDFHRTEVEPRTVARTQNMYKEVETSDFHRTNVGPRTI